DQITKNQVHYKLIEVANDIEFAEDSYESVIINLNSLIKCIDLSIIQEYNGTKKQCLDSQDEIAITITSKKDSSKPIYKHPIKMNYSFLNKIQHTQAILETIKQNLTYRAKYNQNLALQKKLLNIPKKHIKSIFENFIYKYQSKSKTYTATKNLQNSNY
ncbi:12083_t:CDS:2, partial [Racocetra fulgida]